MSACLRPRKPDVVARSIEGEAVVVNLSTDVYYRLDRVGAAVWSLIEQGKCLADIVEALAQAYGIGERQVRDDVQRLAEQMLQEELVCLGEGNGSAAARDVPKPAAPYEQPKLRIYRMSTNVRLRANEPEIAAKVVDGEAIIINVLTGAYYSMDGVGAVIWSLIESGCSNQQITESIAASYGVSQEHVRADLERLSSRLLEERIVLIVGGSPAPAVPSLPPPAHAYEPPRLNLYTDMEDLLAIDPPLPIERDAHLQKDRHIGDIRWAAPQ
jgi:hypothetical protein